MKDLKYYRDRAIRLIKEFRNLPESCFGMAMNDAKKGELVTIRSHIDEEWTKFLFDITEEELS